MSIIPHVSHAMQSLLTTTTESAAATHGYVKRADRATFTPSTLVRPTSCTTTGPIPRHPHYLPGPERLHTK